MRFYYSAAFLFRVNPRIHTIGFTLLLVVRKKEQPLDSTLKEIAFHIKKHKKHPNTVPCNEENTVKTNNSRAEASC